MKQWIRFAVSVALCIMLLAANLSAVSAAGTFYAKAEMLLIKSHIEKDAGMDEYATVQGACTDGKYAYFALMQGGAATISKYDIKSWEFIEKKRVSNIGHGNDLTYNADKQYIVAANNAPYYDTVTLIDPDTLTAIEDVQLKVKIYSIAYNAARNVYVVGISGSYDYALLDENFEVIKEFEGTSTGYTRQGCDCDDNYIYFAQSGGKNLIAVYDYSGDYITSVPLTSSDEVENLFHVGNTYYASLHYYGNSVYRVGFSGDTQIAYTVSYDAGEGTGKMDATTVRYGVKTQLAKCTFKRDGYFFAGWRVQRDSDGRYIGYRNGSDKYEWLSGDEVYDYLLYDDKEPVAETVRFGNIRLTAVWISAQYGIDFDSDGGEGEMTPVMAAYDETVTLPESGYAKEGYIFDGYTAVRGVDGRVYGYREGGTKAAWLKAEDVGEPYVFEPGEEVSRLTYDGRVTLTAQFKFAYTFADGGSTLVEYAGVDEKVVIPGNEGELTTLAEGAIKENENMTELYIPACVESLQKQAVTDCPRLKSIYFEGSLPKNLDADSVVDSYSPVVYRMYNGQAFCIGFFADSHSAALIRCHADALDQALQAHRYE